MIVPRRLQRGSVRSKKEKRYITKHHGEKNKETNKKADKLKQYNRKNVNRDQFFHHFNSGSLVHNYQTCHASFTSLSIILIGTIRLCTFYCLFYVRSIFV